MREIVAHVYFCLFDVWKKSHLHLAYFCNSNGEPRGGSDQASFHLHEESWTFNKLSFPQIITGEENYYSRNEAAASKCASRKYDGVY